MMLWAICYDISDDRSRRKVEKVLRGEGERVQWSLFECYLSAGRMASLRAKLLEWIDPATDSLRFYPLCHWCDEQICWQGQGKRTEDADLWIV